MQDKLVADLDARATKAREPHPMYPAPGTDEMAAVLGYQLAFHRLAGDRETCDRIMERIMAEGAQDR